MAEACLALIVMGAALGLAFSYLYYHTPLDARYQLTTPGFFAPAAMMASGRGLVSPEPGVCAPLDDFLSGDADAFSPEALPQEMTPGRLDPYSVSHIHLLRTVGLVWRLFGISWKNLALVSIFLYAFSALALYYLFRLGIGPMLSLGLSLALLSSPGVLSWLPNIRDFSKMPFFFLTWYLLGRVVKERLSPKALCLHALALGLSIGLGLGFRTDLLICVLPTLIILTIFARMDQSGRLRSRMVALLIFLIAFTLTGAPILNKILNDAGGEASHNIMGGFAAHCFETLGAQAADYEVLLEMGDDEIHACIAAHGFCLQEDYLAESFMGPRSGKAGKALIRELIWTFPADFLSRWYGATLWALGGAEADTPTVDNPFLDQLAAWTRPVVRHLDAWKIYYAALTLLLLAAIHARYAWAFLLAILYFGGYTSLQFDPRHAFHLYVAALWTFGFVLSTLCLRPLLSQDLRQRIRLALGNPAACLSYTARNLALFTLPAALLLITPYYAAGLLQQSQVSRLSKQYASTPLRAIESHRRETAEEILVSPKTTLPGLSTPEESWDPLNERWKVKVAYLVLRLQSVEKPVPLSIRYWTPGGKKGLNRRYIVRPPGEGAQDVKVFLPIYQMFFSTAQDPAPDSPPERCKFLGIALNKETASCLEGMYVVDHPRDFSLLPLWVLPEKTDLMLAQRPFLPHYATLERQLERAIRDEKEDLALSICRQAEAFGAPYAGYIRAKAVDRLAILAAKLEAETETTEDRIIEAWQAVLTLDPAKANHRRHMAALLTQQAVSLEYAGQLAQALDTAQQARTFDPVFAAAWQTEAEILLEQGERQEATVCYRRLIDLHPDHPPYYQDLSAIYAARNDLDGEVEEWRQMLTTHPERFMAYRRLGEIYRRNNKVEEALNAYRNAFTLEPEDKQNKALLVQSLLEAARFHAEKGAWEKAGACCEEAAPMTPDHPEIQGLWAASLAATGDKEGAKEHYRKAIALAPLDEAAYQGLSKLYLEQNDTEGLLSEWQVAARKEPHHPLILLQLARAHEAQGHLAKAADIAWRATQDQDLLSESAKAESAKLLRLQAEALLPDEKAIAYARRALRLSPQDPNALLTLAQALRQHKDKEEATALFRQSIALAPVAEKAYEEYFHHLHTQADSHALLKEGHRLQAAHPHSEAAHYFLCRALAQAGEIEEALRLSRDFLKKHPENARYTSFTATLLLQHAQNLKGAAAVEKAHAALREALDLAPEDSVFLAELAQLFTQTGLREEAIACYCNALNLTPHSYALYEAFSQFYLDAQDLEGLTQEWEKQAQAHPDRILNFFSLGLAYERQHRYEEALAAYEKALEIIPDAKGTHDAIARVKRSLAGS